MEEQFASGGVRGVLHRPEQPGGDALILTHGAGSDSNTVLLTRVARAFEASGYLVLRYDLPFRQMRKPPNPANAVRDREGILEAAAAIRSLTAGRLLAGGHSYGGRQTAMTAAEHPDLAAGILLLSYPLHPPAKPQQLRTAFFPELRTPALFVHGTRDGFGSPEELREAMALISAPTDLLVVEGAGHDLKRAADLTADILTRLRALVCYPES
jgi:predicted alpha/beta-hydrolase family hydrolase